MSRLLCGVIIGLAGCVVLSVTSATLAADVLPRVASAPASQPAGEIILMRVGPRVVTQEDFNYEAGRFPPEQAKALRSGILRELVGRRLFSLYIQDHPDLVDEAVLEKRLESAYKEEGVKNRTELEAKLKARNDLRKLDDFVDRARVLIARGELVRRAVGLGAYEALAKQTFEQDPTAFDGSRMKVRQILIATQLWDTPAQLKVKREKAEKIREDLVSGRRTWEQCIDESDDTQSRAIGGDLGMVPRHLEKPEAISAAAFALKVGETSPVIETPFGYHIIQITQVHKGLLKETDAEARRQVKRWLVRKTLLGAEDDAREKFPVIGVKEPEMPPPPPPSATKPAPTMRPRMTPSTRPQFRPTTRPVIRPSTRPAVRPSTRPAPIPPPARGLGIRPATRPAK